MILHELNGKYTAGDNYQSIYDSSYDYAIYDIKFIFNNEDDEAEYEISHDDDFEQDYIA